VIHQLADSSGSFQVSFMWWGVLPTDFETGGFRTSGSTKHFCPKLKALASPKFCTILRPCFSSHRAHGQSGLDTLPFKEEPPAICLQVPTMQVCTLTVADWICHVHLTTGSLSIGWRAEINLT
jgi:hypothetical protein